MDLLVSPTDCNVSVKVQLKHRLNLASSIYFIKNAFPLKICSQKTRIFA
jgi:hypothetical protein